MWCVVVLWCVGMLVARHSVLTVYCIGLINLYLWYLRTSTLRYAVDIGTSIFQERWLSVDEYVAHMENVKAKYISFLGDIDICKLDIIGTESAITHTAVRDFFHPFRPKYSALDLDKRI